MLYIVGLSLRELSERYCITYASRLRDSLDTWSRGQGDSTTI